jgi:hypothetical protein
MHGEDWDYSRQEGDYAVDHGHTDDMYAPGAGMLEAEEIRRECAEAERRLPRRDNVLVTRPYHRTAGRS